MEIVLFKKITDFFFGRLRIPQQQGDKIRTDGLGMQKDALTKLCQHGVVVYISSQ